jgi:hypothetical protein
MSLVRSRHPSFADTVQDMDPDMPYVPDHGIMMITVGQTHGVKWDRIQKGLDSKIFEDWQNNNRLLNPAATDLNEKRKVRLIFLCDSFNYPHFKKQNWLGAGGTSYKDLKKITECDALGDQYAWELVHVQLGVTIGRWKQRMNLRSR